jgi:hypothetical protein
MRVGAAWAVILISALVFAINAPVILVAFAGVMALLWAGITLLDRYTGP